MRRALIAAAFALVLVPEAALSAENPLRDSVMRELRIVHPEAATQDLSDDQISRIHLILHGSGSQGTKVRKIDSVLGKCLFGCLLFGNGVQK